MPETNTDQVRLSGGSLYLNVTVCERFLNGVQNVALLREGGKVYLIPLARAGTGGHLLKVRNSRGDRVIHCPEFLQQLGAIAEGESAHPISWESDRHALTFSCDTHD